MPTKNGPVFIAETSRVAAKKWREMVENPKLDNGNDDPMLKVLVAAAQANRSQHTTESLDKFEKLLTEEFNEIFKNPASYEARHGIRVGVDYHPDLILRQCAEQAGLRTDLISWPWKTVMQITYDSIMFREGYSGEMKTIWTKES